MGERSSVNGWRGDKQWSDQFLPEVKQILGLHLIGEAPIEEDQERNTDLIVLRLDAVRVGCRIRRADPYLQLYPDEFTIRTSRPRGTKTELAKIIEGWGDFFFYGFGGDNGALARWGLGDLRVFRLWFNSQLVRNNGRVPGQEKRNGDGSSEFRAFRWRELPSGFCIAASFELEDAA